MRYQQLAESAKQAAYISLQLLQLRVLRLGLFQDRDVGISVFPEREEIFVSSERSDAGGVGVSALRSSRLQCVRTSHAQMRQRSRPTVPNDPIVVNDFLELSGRRSGLARFEICLATYVDVIEAGEIADESDLPQLVAGGSL